MAVVISSPKRTAPGRPASPSTSRTRLRVWKGPQSRLRRRRPALLALHRAGRRHPPAPRSPAVLEKIGQMAAAEIPPRHQCLPRRRRQPPPHRPLPGRKSRRRSPRRRSIHTHPRRLRRRRRLHHRRARSRPAKSSAACPTCTPPPDLETMQRVRHAFDPQNIANPDKLFPTPRLCGERSPRPLRPPQPRNQRHSGDLLMPFIALQHPSKKRSSTLSKKCPS